MSKSNIMYFSLILLLLSRCLSSPVPKLKVYFELHCNKNKKSTKFSQWFLTSEILCKTNPLKLFKRKREICTECFHWCNSFWMFYFNECRLLSVLSNLCMDLPFMLHKKEPTNICDLEPMSNISCLPVYYRLTFVCAYLHYLSRP